MEKNTFKIVPDSVLLVESGLGTVVSKTNLNLMIENGKKIGLR